MDPDRAPDPSVLLRRHGLRVTRQRVSVMEALNRAPHSAADTVLGLVRSDIGPVSTQAVYDVLNTMTARGLVRRIQPAGSPALYEVRTADNHHHVVCRTCGSVLDVDCATRAAPCLDPVDLEVHAPGFVVDEAEVTFWGRCDACARSAPLD